MISVSASADVGIAVAFVTWPVLNYWMNGVRATISPVPVSYIASSGGCRVLSIVIVLLFNCYLIFRMLNMMNIF